MTLLICLLGLVFLRKNTSCLYSVQLCLKREIEAIFVFLQLSLPKNIQKMFKHGFTKPHFRRNEASLIGLALALIKRHTPYTTFFM